MKKVRLGILKWILKLLSRATVARYKPGIVGITGTVGKTSTKEAIRTVLGFDRRVRAPSKSFNNELGLPLTILGDWDSTGGVLFWLKVIFVSLWRLIVPVSSYPEMLVLEYGVDRPGDMNYLLAIARPHIAVFTALGEIPVHVEFFAGPEALFHEKVKLINQLPTTGFAILNGDDLMVREAKEQTRAQVITYGFDGTNDMRISNFAHHFDGDNATISFKLTYSGSFVPVKIDGVVGKSQTYATAAAATVGLIFGMNLVTIAEALRKYSAPQGRLKVIPGIKESVLIDDTYNASPIAMHEALDALRDLKAKRKIAVLGDMLEIGKYTLQAHEAIGRLVPKCSDMLIAVGLRAKFIADAAERAGMKKTAVASFMNLAEAGKYLQSKIQRGDLILIKGSQGVRLEKAVKEVMREPAKAEELLVRQASRWSAIPGLYDE